MHATKYKRSLSFNLEVRLKSIELHIEKPVNLRFEFTYGKSVICTKNFHRVDGRSFRAKVEETVEFPVTVSYDPRKDYFSSHNLEINVLFQNPKFSKKIASTSLSIAQILNARVVLSREKLKLEKCSDKNAYINLTAELEFKGAGNNQSMDRSIHSLSKLRWVHKRRTKRQD